MGVKDVILCDTKGIIYEGRPAGMNSFKEEMARITNKEKNKDLWQMPWWELMYLSAYLPRCGHERNDSFHESPFDYFCNGKSGT